MQINNGASSASGGFFKPAEHKSAALIIFEPERSVLDTQYKNQDGSAKHNVLGKFTIFLSDNELEQGKPNEVMEGAICSSGTLAKALIETAGQVTAGHLEQVPSKTPGRQPYWTIASATAEQIEQAVAYLEAREAAKTEALPGFFN